MSDLLLNEQAAREWMRARFSVTDGQWSALETFAQFIREENDRQNLIAASTLPNLWVRHIVDSAQLLIHSGDEAGVWMDLGSGAGLPGLVIAILRDHPITLVESRKLRCNFLRNVAEALNLKHVTVAETRLEALTSFKAAVITARAFAPLEKLLKLSGRFAHEKTVWLLPKGRNAVIELETLPHSCQNMFHVEQSLTDVDSRILVGRGQLPAKQREQL